jgi:hypothetical protein
MHRFKCTLHWLLHPKPPPPTPSPLLPRYSIHAASYAQGPGAQAYELEELTQIYVGRGLDYDLARKVAEKLTTKDVIRVRPSVPQCRYT